MDASAKSRYEALKVRRQSFLDRARQFAELTIPSLMPPEGWTGTQTLYEPYQSFGARGTTFLASRLMSALLPAGQKFFRFQVPPEVLMKAGQASTNKDTEQQLTIIEDTVQAEVERRQWRSATNLTLQHLIVTGNALEKVEPDNRIRVFRLDQYVVVRDPQGDLKEIIVEEFLLPASMPEHMRAMITQEEMSHQAIPLYTWVRLNGDRWLVHQELNDSVVPNSRGVYKRDFCPFNAIRWQAVLGEDYGRSKIEEHSGDLRSAEVLRKAMLDGSAMAARNVFGVRPNAAGGLNLRKRLASARNGDVIVFNPEDVIALEFKNAQGLQVASQELVSLVSEIKAAFLMTSSVQRQGERVTATELRMMAEELDGTLGGVFSSLSVDVQLHRLNRLVYQMQARGQLPEWPQGTVEPTILTGLEALGRERDVQKVSTALQFLQGLPPEVQDYVKWPVMFGKAFNGLGLPDAVRSDAEVAQIQQQRAAQEAIARATNGAGEQLSQAASQAQGVTDQSQAAIR